MTLRIGSLFSGYGGLEIGIAQALTDLESAAMFAVKGVFQTP